MVEHDIQTNLKAESVNLQVKTKNYLECGLSHQQKLITLLHRLYKAGNKIEPAYPTQ